MLSSWDHPTVFTCCPGGHLRPKHEEFEGSCHVGYSTARTLIQQHENYGRLSSRMQVAIGPTYQENLSKWSTATWSEVRKCSWGEVGSSLWDPRTPCGIWRCMMVMLYVRWCRLRRAKSFSRTCPLWKAPGKKWSAATQIAFRYHVRDILSETMELLTGYRVIRRAPKPRISFKLFVY